MTQEEKAKRYDKAIERAKNYYSTTDSASDIKLIELIFPELKESEDERIRKAQLDYWRSVGGKEWHGVPVQEVIAWLEKQGESIKIKKGKNYLCTKTHKYAGVEWIEGVKYYSPEDYSLVNQGCTCYCPKYSKEEHNNFFKEVEYDGWLEKQGKKYKWTQDDEQYLLVCKNALRKYYGSDKWDADIISKWLEDKLKQGEQKPAWSEKDENFFANICSIIDADRNFTESAKRRCKDWLKSLKQK